VFDVRAAQGATKPAEAKPGVGDHGHCARSPRGIQNRRQICARRNEQRDSITWADTDSGQSRREIADDVMQLSPSDRASRPSFTHLDDRRRSFLGALVQRSPKGSALSRTNPNRRWRRTERTRVSSCYVGHEAMNGGGDWCVFDD
jgi:hypothetical protein